MSTKIDQFSRTKLTKAQSLGWQQEALRSTEITRSRWSLIFLTRIHDFRG